MMKKICKHLGWTVAVEKGMEGDVRHRLGEEINVTNGLDCL